MRKCPPGVICLENVSLVFIFLIICFFSFLFFRQNVNVNNNERIIITPNNHSQGMGIVPNYPYNNLPAENENVLLNPYSAPLKDDRYFVPSLDIRQNPIKSAMSMNAVPINVSTNIGAVDTSYRQLGILKPVNGRTQDSILPLMGRPLYTSRQKFQYYTISNQHNNVKLPISVAGKSALNEYGVDELFTGDTIFVDGLDGTFSVTIYENSTMKYLPFL